MAGGTFKLSQGKVRPGTYVNIENRKQPTVTTGLRGTACVPLIGYDWGPRDEWIVLNAGSPDAEKAKLGRSIYDDNDHMLLIQLLFMGATTVYAFIPDGGTAAKATVSVSSAEVTFNAKYKGTLGNKLQVASAENPAGGFDVSVYLGGEEVEVFEGITTLDEITSDYITVTGSGNLSAFASASLSGGTDAESTKNEGVTKFLDMSEKVRFNCMCFPTEEASLQAALLTKIRYIRESIGWKCQAVAPNFAADYEGIINLTNSFEYDGKNLTTAQATAWLAGVTAGADYATSNTYAVVEGATKVVGEKSNESSIEAIKAGEAFFTIDENGEVILETDINSLVKIGANTPQDFNKNRPLRVYDTFANDCLTTFIPNRFNGNEEGYTVIEGLGRSMLQAYAADNAIQNVDLENDFAVDRTQSAGDYVVIYVGLQTVDSIEKYYITVIAQ